MLRGRRGEKDRAGQPALADLLLDSQEDGVEPGTVNVAVINQAAVQLIER
jgi:hypothetical protein